MIHSAEFPVSSAPFLLGADTQPSLTDAIALTPRYVTSPCASMLETGALPCGRQQSKVDQMAKPHIAVCSEVSHTRTAFTSPPQTLILLVRDEARFKTMIDPMHTHHLLENSSRFSPLLSLDVSRRQPTHDLWRGGHAGSTLNGLDCPFHPLPVVWLVDARSCFARSHGQLVCVLHCSRLLVLFTPCAHSNHVRSYFSLSDCVAEYICMFGPRWRELLKGQRVNSRKEHIAQLKQRGEIS